MAVLLASAARTASGEQVLDGDFNRYDSAFIELIVTAAATDVGDLLDVYVQHSIDDGVTWDDFIHFTQVLGNGGAKRFMAAWAPKPTVESELRAYPVDAGMAAGVLQGPTGKKWRLKWVIVDAGTDNASFTFAVNGFFTGRSSVSLR